MADNFDQFFPDWTTGTLTITSGSKNFTATNAQLNIAPVRAGDTIITPSGLSLIIATINANGNGGTLFFNAPAAAAGTFQTCIRFQSDNSRYTGAVAALVKLATGGNLFSLAGIALKEGDYLRALGAGILGVMQGKNLDELASLAKANNQFITMGANGSIASKPIADITNAIDSKFDKAGGTVAGNLDMQGTARLRSDNQRDNTPFQYIRDYNYVNRWAFLMYPDNDFLYCVWSGAGYVRDVVRFRQNGSVNFFGSLSKGSGTFLIDHPLDPLNKNLRHGFVEAPEYLNIYRGTVRLVNGRATVNIDDYFDMMQGTFWALNTDVIVSSLQNQDGFSRVRPDGKMTDGTLNIICEDEACNDEVAWMVTGRRKDAYVLHLDPNCERGTGRFISEIEKED